MNIENKKLLVYRLPILFVLLLGPLSCVSSITSDALTGPVSLRFESVESYSINDNHVDAICVTARYNSNRIKAYVLRVQEASWSYKCENNITRAYQYCNDLVPISVVKKRTDGSIGKTTIERGCNIEGKPKNLNIKIDNSENGDLLISDAHTKQKLLYVSGNSGESYRSPLIYPLYPVAVLIDVVTSPIQVIIGIGALIIIGANFSP